MNEGPGLSQSLHSDVRPGDSFIKVITYIILGSDLEHRKKLDL